MNSINCGKGLFIFSITFLIGIFFTLVFESTETIVSPSQNKLNQTSKINCKEKTDKSNEIHRLLRERIDLEVEIRRAKTFPEDNVKVKIYSERLRKINQQIEQIDREIREGKYQIESPATHNLLHVEKCFEI